MNLYKVPSEIKFSLPFNDNSGNRHVVSFKEGDLGVHLKDVDKDVYIEIEDIEWVIDCLRDAKMIAQESLKQKKETA